ncbi:MAG: BatD family protein, partial [Desulfobacterales bacterium]|nr:BatD family protein [Desulfobacterales bacterium]
MKKILFIFFYLFFVLPKAYSAGSISVFVDKTEVELNGSIQFNVIIKNGEGDIDTTPIKDFKVISQGKNTSVQIINNKVNRELSFNYILVPLKEGTLTIPELEVTVNGKIEKTDAININVSKSVTASTNYDNTKDVFVKAEVSQNNPYDGEHILYKFKLYQGVQISNPRLQKPEFKDFSAKPLEEKKPYNTVVSGREYTVIEVDYLLIPLKTGEIRIDSAVLNFDMVYRKKNRRGFPSNSPFDSLFDDPF